MKRLAAILSALLLVSLATGCGGGSKSPVHIKGPTKTIALLPSKADSSGLNQDQIALLQQTLEWMDRDLAQGLKRRRFNVVRINDETEFGRIDGNYLLKINITNHRLIPKGARFLAGMMAGSDLITANYTLIDARGLTLLSWDDAQGSAKSGTRCASTLNRNATNKLVTFMSDR
jgi:hypothetical protein